MKYPDLIHFKDMKKFIFIALFGLLAFVSQAQIPGIVTSFVNETTTNTETKYLVIASPKALTINYVIGIQVKPVNAGGTATVTAAIQTSNDNINWYEYGTSTTVNTAGAASLYSWLITDSPFKYYRVKLVSSGTGVTNFYGNMLIKKKDI